MGAFAGGGTHNANAVDVMHTCIVRNSKPNQNEIEGVKGGKEGWVEKEGKDGGLYVSSHSQGVYAWPYRRYRQPVAWNWNARV